LQELDPWIKAIQNNIVQSPVLQLINMKKLQMAREQDKERRASVTVSPTTSGTLMPPATPPM
jgi:hypothetical protein